MRSSSASRSPSLIARATRLEIALVSCAHIGLLLPDPLAPTDHKHTVSMMPLEDVRCISTSSAPAQRPARGQRRDEEIGLGSCRPPAFLPWRRVKKPGAPGVTEGKGKERRGAPGLLTPQLCRRRVTA